MYILSKNIFLQNSTGMAPQGKMEEKVTEGEYRWNFEEKCFLIKYTWFDATFYPDSEYHIYFARKMSFGGQNLKIRAEFLTFSHCFRKHRFSQRGNKIILNPYVRFFLIGWPFEWCMNVDEKFWNKKLDRFARQGCQHAIFLSSFISWLMMTMSKFVEDHLNLHGNTQFEMLSLKKVVSKTYSQWKGMNFDFFF